MLSIIALVGGNQIPAALTWIPKYTHTRHKKELINIKRVKQMYDLYHYLYNITIKETDINQKGIVSETCLFTCSIYTGRLIPLSCRRHMSSATTGTRHK